MEAIQVLTYICLLLFLGFVIGRVVKYLKTPIHLRWELYPVAHEKGRADYGGSYFEEFEWWNKPRQKDRINEIKVMFTEIIFLKGVFEHNRPLWWVSFPFHFGLYLLIGWLGVLALAAFLAAIGVSLGGGFGTLIRYLAAGLGYAGLGLTALGCLGLLFRRALNADLRRYSVPLEFINLLAILSVVVVALIVHLSSDPWFGMPVMYIYSLFTFSAPMPMSTGMQVEIILASLLFAYIPMTRMAHFVSKYFLYHDVRWSDEPNFRGGKIEARLKEAFEYRMKWAGPHIQTGKSWAHVGTHVEQEKEVEK
ncbi:MAG: respiratory nitrate reductase subunit gamma [Deltaproteobacteria bacterium]|nr:respiratory nitrate reductase subunit gamma [Deltaproteobacteria bacterium]